MTTGLCECSGDGEGTSFVDSADSSLSCPQFPPKLLRPCWHASPELLWHMEGVIWSVCACWSVCCFSGEKTLHPQREKDCVSVWRGELVYGCMCVFVWAWERDCCVFPWEVKTGHSIHQKTLISPFDEKGIESWFWSQPPTETAGQSCSPISQHGFRSVSPNTFISTTIISYHLQSNVSPIQSSNACSWKKLVKIYSKKKCSAFHKDIMVIIFFFLSYFY